MDFFGSEGLCPEMLLDSFGAYQFPLYFQGKPYAITGVVEKDLPGDYKETIEFLSQFPL